MKQWVRKCSTSHERCKIPHQQSGAPSRLIFIGDKIPRLHLSKNLAECPTYATLSHCWGKAIFATLTKGNLEAFQKRIPPEALSKTFQDAIFITQELNIEYIWIDSLCIVQDDLEDWRVESASMASVYGGSIMNIAASGAIDGTRGCFFDRDTSWRCQVEAGTKEKLLYDCTPYHLIEKSLAEMPLQRRAWTLQERLLPTRTVHFTATQLFWECNEIVACEAFPGIFPSVLREIDETYLWKRPFTRGLWEWAVRHYSKCGLTKSSDKLVAISGLARVIQLQTNDEYVAGLWRKNVESQLCWYASPEDGNGSTPYWAPTWSWASIDTFSVNFSWMSRAFSRGDSLYIKVLEVSTTPVGHDPLGQISNANLCLSCDLLSHGTCERRAKEYVLVIGKQELKGWVEFDSFPEPQGPMHLMPVKSCGNGNWIVGLILRPTNEAQGEYSRIGMFELPDRRSNWTMYRESGLRYEEAAGDPACQAKDVEYAEIREDEDG